MQYTTAFVSLFIWRYLRLIVNIFAAWTFKPIPLPSTPTYFNRDVTVIIPTLANSEDFRRCLLTVAACNPASIIVVTPRERVDFVRMTCNELGVPHVQILGASRANKRLQMIQGLKEVRTSITFFADDDVFWAPTFLPYNLAPFEDPNVGAVGGLQTLERPSNPNVWDFLSAIYLERRSFEVAATAHIDGGISCLSGRTCAIRTEIVQNQRFIDEFRDEKFLGRLSLVAADDDNFITRYLVNNGWKIAMQIDKGAELTTTLENNPKFVSQCVRWRRTTWRSNFTSLFLERVIWREQPYSTYALHLSSFNPPSLIMDPLLGYLLYRAVKEASPLFSFPSMSATFMLFFLWLIFTKTVKLMPYFFQYPSDLKYLPILFAFGYFHSGVFLYTFFTLHRTTWGGGRSSIVSAYERGGVGAVLSTGYGALKDNSAAGFNSGYNGLKRVGSSASDLCRLGDKNMRGDKVIAFNGLKRVGSSATNLFNIGEKRMLNDKGSP